MSKFRSTVGRTATCAAALGVAVTVCGVAATHPSSISGSLVDLTALIVVGSSTHPDPTGNEDFFGGMFNQYPYNPGGQPRPGLVGVDFRGGTAAINEALQTNSGADNAVLSSGWGAANASLLLQRLDRAADPALPSTLFVLDNNVSRPDGGFGTRYPLFALIGVNPFPSRTDTLAKAVVDIAYQYNYNSNAPADLFNLVAHVNSLVAYLYDYRDQPQIDLPVDVDGRPTVSCGTANTCAVLASGDAVPCEDARCATPDGDRALAYVTTRGNTTYVTYTTDELPLARLIRDVLGDAVADAVAPLLKVIVDSAYYGGNPIPSDPSRYRPARLMPSLGELVSTAAKIPGAIREGLDSLAAKDSPQRSDEPEPSARRAKSAADVSEPGGVDELGNPAADDEGPDTEAAGDEDADTDAADDTEPDTEAEPEDPANADDEDADTDAADDSEPDSEPGAGAGDSPQPAAA